MALWEQSCAGSAGVCEGSRMAQPQHKLFVLLAVLAKWFDSGFPREEKKISKYISFFIIRYLKKSQEEELKMEVQVHFLFCECYWVDVCVHRGRIHSSLLCVQLSVLHQEWIGKSATAPQAKWCLNRCSPFILENRKKPAAAMSCLDKSNASFSVGAMVFQVS